MKAARNDYTEAAFFYREQNGKEWRFVVWDPSETGQRTLFFRLLADMSDRIEYLFKEDLDDESEEIRWVRISGGIYKERLTALIQRFDKWFFSDSIFQFCCREPEVPGYFAYDEHGVFYIYNKEAEEMLPNLGFTLSSKKEILSDKPHWHVRPKDAERFLADFKAELKGSSVFYDDEAEQTH